MIDYRVFCKAITPDISGIYAKATKHSKYEQISWQAADVTNDAINAVVLLHVQGLAIVSYGN